MPPLNDVVTLVDLYNDQRIYNNSVYDHLVEIINEKDLTDPEKDDTIIL